MDKRNRPALGFLLAGLGAAGRALLGVPGSASLAELTLTAMMVVGYLVLARDSWKPLVCGVIQLVLQLYLCGAGVAAGALSTVLLRLGELWLLTAAVWLCLRMAQALAPSGTYGARTAWMPRAACCLLAAQTVTQVAAALRPTAVFCTTATAVLFVAFSVALLWFTVLMVRGYNALRVRKERKREL